MSSPDIPVAVATAHYEVIGSGKTGHAESVRITYDPSQISYSQLQGLLSVAHDPTQLNRQGPTGVHNIVQLYFLPMTSRSGSRKLISTTQQSADLP